MAIDYDRLLQWRIPEVEHRITRRDTILYALGVGLGNDPTSRAELRFVYEKDLVALPTMALVLGHPGFWLKEPGTGVDWVRVVHAGQTMSIHRPLPVEGTVVGTARVADIIDKGEGRGALVTWERKVYDKADGGLICTLEQIAFCRGDGGFGGPRREATPAPSTPDTPPDATCDLPTLPQAALIYRLNGDYNPLHADPDVARAAGFERPILHGLCTLGVAGHAILKTGCGYDAARLVGMEGRFSAPVYPGETLRTEIWSRGAEVAFRTTVPARGVVVINHGRALITA